MASPFETGERKAIPAVLIYPSHRGRLLMLHRNVKENDYHQGKWNGLGGKLELDESPLQGAKRELMEESGLDLDSEAFRYCGVLQFPNFKAHKSEDWIVWVFSATVSDEKALHAEGRGPEGEMKWIEAGEVLGLNLWAGDRLFLPKVLDGTNFFGTIWYRGEEVLRSELQS